MRVMSCVSLLWITLTAAPALSATIPFTEGFDADASNWYDAGSTGPLSWVPAGGPDGSAYASGSFNFAPFIAGDTLSAARAQDEFGSSGGAFEGNYIVEGVLSLSVFVRHDAPVPLNVFSRLSGPANFPGAIAIAFVPVLPNTWTEIVFDLTVSSPHLVSFEGSSYAAVFSNVGHVQFGVEVPALLAGSDVDYDFQIDGVSLVPEPTTAGMMVLGLFGIALAGRSPR